ISSAAKASAAVRLPTPAGPWKRYACAGRSAIAARSRRFASACSGKLSNASTDLLCDLVGRPLALDADDPVGKHRRKLAVRAIDRAMEVLALALDPVGGARPDGRGRRVDEHEEGSVRKEPADRVPVQLEHFFDAEAARDP